MANFDELSGSKERRRFLLAANLLLFCLGVTMLILAIILIASYLLNELTFVSSLFLGAPVLLLVAGLLTVGVATYGLILWRAKREMTSGFNVLAVGLFVTCILCLVSCILAFLLREVIAHNFSKTSVQPELRRFGVDADVTARWNRLQRTYECCGGGENGYGDWQGPDGIVTAGN